MYRDHLAAWPEHLPFRDPNQSPKIPATTLREVVKAFQRFYGAEFAPQNTTSNVEVQAPLSTWDI